MSIAGMNAIVDQRLEDGTYFTHYCSHCHQLYHLEQPFLYHDPERKFLLILSRQEKISNLPKDELVVRCKNALQFLFCFKVLHLGLDLQKVTVHKKYLEKKYHKIVKFDAYDVDTNYLWFYVDNELIAVKYE